MKRLCIIMLMSLTAVFSLSSATDSTLEGLKSRLTGTWTSIACEIRPQPNQANPNTAPTPSYLTRHFVYDANDGFAANITVYADPGCSKPIVSYDFAGELVWHGANPAAAGAWSQDYVLNRKLELTVIAQPMADRLNALPPGACGDSTYEVGKPQDILGKPCVLLKFLPGNQYVVDHDFLYIREDTPSMLFMGAKHVDGTGFYLPENRPVVGLQQPLIRVN